MPSDLPYPLAPLGRRAAAWGIDIGLGAMLSFALIDLAGGKQDLRAAWQLIAFKSVNGKSGHQLSAAVSPAGMNLAAMKPVLGLLAMLGVVAVVGVAYRVATNALWGAGIGKWLLGLRVIVDSAEHEELSPPGWAKAWKRWAVPQAPGLIPLPATSLLAYLPAAKDARRRGLHDRAAGTIVVDVRADRRRPEPLEDHIAIPQQPWRLAELDGYHSSVPVGALAGAGD